MIAKVVVYGDTREEAVYQMLEVLDSSKIIGPTTNLDYCKTILRTEGEFIGIRIHTWEADTLTSFQKGFDPYYFP